MTDTLPSAAAGVFHQPFPEQVAFFRKKLGDQVPTASWKDLTKSAHDRSFMVAGAAKADLLSDLGSAVDRAISEGTTIEQFRKDFKSIVAKNGWHGWTGEGSVKGEAWRTKVIYQTNTSTSYSAGRLAQLRAGNFELWIYRHNDSVRYPRPMHVSWNGITLPPDHPFWKTHYTPNGWLCHCYIVGARSAAGARRLGGNPDKELPAGWDARDPKTGEPPGIDKGWGYMPGDTVDDTVQAMAKKTQQWEYSIAKSYMQGVPESVRDSLSTSYRALPSVADDSRRYAQSAIAGKDVPPYRTLGLITSADAAIVKEQIDANVSMFDFALDASGIRHIASSHGDQKAEDDRGQVAVQASDYEQLGNILNAPDTITDAGSSRQSKQQLVMVRKVVDDREYVTVWEIRKGRKMLALQSYWITKKAP